LNIGIYQRLNAAAQPASVADRFAHEISGILKGSGSARGG